MNVPTKRIDVPTIIMKLSEYDDESLEILCLELQRCVRLLDLRRKDNRLLPIIKRRAKSKLRGARRNLTRVERELNGRQESGETEYANDD